ncbi:hypothetical protein ERX46_15770 [Brumimicrobium glaciale]|uniref:tRNA (Guanine-N1)-methyltransferase n=1 Tax=Brumimicrobium glaciale TaxID=200475 RepID=A0A4Q4KH37_9FLAO|nr:hypothetical protein [Brumimicrobium glaciale]RYM32138.1 hypothetical protein ERX46_15770 [Brumimicrobium glaciale]
MKKKIFYLSALFISLSLNGISQEEESNSIESQFNNLIENSNSYQSFKVIDKSKLGVIQSNIQDSISSLKTKIGKSEIQILDQKAKIDSNEQKIQELNTALDKSKNSVDNIDFLGMPTHKSSYTFIMWTIIFVLLAISLIMFVIFKKGHRNTKNAKEKLEETQNELESLRKRSLEREQKVRRELQNEINKNNLRKD